MAKWQAFATATLVAASLSCVDVMTTSTGGSSSQNQGGNGDPSATPSPGSGGTLPAGSSVRIGLFGQSCPAGTPVPTNGLGIIRLGCVGFVTATPKGPDGLDLPPAVHGPNCSWSVTSGQGVVNVTSTAEAFNRDVRCVTVGQFGLQAVVKDVTGQRDFRCESGTTPTPSVSGARVYFWTELATPELKASVLARAEQ